MGEQWWPCIYIYIYIHVYIYIYIYIISLKKTCKIYHFKILIATNNLIYIYIHMDFNPQTYSNLHQYVISTWFRTPFFGHAALHRWPRWKHGQDITAAYCSLWTASSSWCVPRNVFKIWRFMAVDPWKRWFLLHPQMEIPFLENLWCLN